jgi:hypothetical protein
MKLSIGEIIIPSNRKRLFSAYMKAIREIGESDSVLSGYL